MSLREQFVKAVSLLPEKPLVVEVGSHEGDGVKYILSKRPLANVYAIEPSVASYKKLKRVHGQSANVAISDRMGDVAIVERENSRRNIIAEVGMRRINQMPLDSFLSINGIFGEKIDLIRFDCYGAEYKIFHTDNEFLKYTDMVYVTMHKQEVCPKVKIKRERSHIKECLRNAGFWLKMFAGSGVDKHLYQIWKKK